MQKDHNPFSKRNSCIKSPDFAPIKCIQSKNRFSIISLGDEYYEDMGEGKLKNKIKVIPESENSALSFGKIMNPSGSSIDKITNNEFLQDFKKFVSIKQKKIQSSSSAPFEDQVKKDNKRNSKELINIKIMNDMRRKLKIKNKSKVEKFEESMAMFKDTETYIEIKPFLEQMNMLNHQNYINEIIKYENNIQEARENEKHSEFVQNILPSIQEELIPEKIRESDQKMKQFKNLILKAGEAIQKGSLNPRKNLTQEEIILNQLFKEYGWQTQSARERQVQLNQSNRNKQGNMEENKQFFKTEVQQEDEEEEEIEGKAKQNQSFLSLNEKQGDQENYDNQFFSNLEQYLRKAQNEISLKNEIESEKNMYSVIIQQNQQKINEAKQHRLKKYADGQLDPEKLFADDKNIFTDQYYEIFRQKAEQVRITLKKVNQEIFQQKWANAQVKRKAERQKERIKFLNSFKGIKIEETNMEDLLNPSKRMNDKILKRRGLLSNQAFLMSNKPSILSSANHARQLDQEIDSKIDEIQHSSERNQESSAKVNLNMSIQSQNIDDKKPFKESEQSSLNPQQLEITMETTPFQNSQTQQKSFKLSSSHGTLPSLQNNKSFSTLTPIKDTQRISEKNNLKFKLESATPKRQIDPKKNFSMINLKKIENKQQFHLKNSYSRLETQTSPRSNLQSSFQENNQTSNSIKLPKISKVNAKQNSIHHLLSPLKNCNSYKQIEVLNKLSPSLHPLSNSENIYLSSNRHLDSQIPPLNQTEEQVRMDELLQQIEEEKLQFQEEKGQLQNEITLIDQNQAQDFQKLKREDILDSLRGMININQNIPKWLTKTKVPKKK